MASGSEVTCRTWTGDGEDLTIEAQRTVNSVEIFNITDGIAYLKLNTMAGLYAVKEDIAGARTFANNLISFDAAGNVLVKAAVNVDAKVLHIRIIC